MCLEDYKIGRRTKSGQAVVSVGTSSTPLVGESPHRTALLISAPTTNPVTLSLAPAAVAAEGLRLAAGSNPLILTLVSHGDLVRRAWSAIAVGGAETIGVVETFLPE